MKAVLFPLLVLTLSAPFQARSADLNVSITDLQPQKGGQIVVGVFDNENDFPKEPNRMLSQILVPADAAQFKIENVPAGEYAIALFHDENKNGKIDGFPPTEGYAFSNNARGTFGPPSFQKAKFTVTEPRTNISIKMRY